MAKRKAFFDQKRPFAQLRKSGLKGWVGFVGETGKAAFSECGIEQDVIGNLEPSADYLREQELLEDTYENGRKVDKTTLRLVMWDRGILPQGGMLQPPGKLQAVPLPTIGPVTPPVETVRL